MGELILQMTALLAFSFFRVAAKAFQQLNVVHGYERLVPIMTFVMAVCEVGTIGSVAYQTITGTWAGVALSVVVITAGASVGAIAAMRLHAKLRRWMNGRQDPGRAFGGDPGSVL